MAITNIALNTLQVNCSVTEDVQQDSCIVKLEPFSWDGEVAA